MNIHELFFEKSREMLKNTKNFMDLHQNLLGFSSG